MAKRTKLTGLAALTPRQHANVLLAKQANKIIALRECASVEKGGWTGTSVRYHIDQACSELAIKARWDAMSMWELIEEKGML